MPEVLTQYPDDYVFPEDGADVYGLYGPIRTRPPSRRVPDITSEHWNALSEGWKFESITLYPFRCEKRRKEKLDKKRKELQDILTASNAVSSYAGYKVKIEDRKSEEIAAAADFLTIYDLGRGEVNATHTDDQAINQKDSRWPYDQKSRTPQLPIMVTPFVQPHTDRIPTNSILLIY